MDEKDKLVLEALSVLLTPNRYGSNANEYVAKRIDDILKPKAEDKELKEQAKKALDKKGQSIEKPKVTILDNNPLSIASFMEEHPDVDL